MSLLHGDEKRGTAIFQRARQMVNGYHTRIKTAKMSVEKLKKVKMLVALAPGSEPETFSCCSTVQFSMRSVFVAVKLIISQHCEIEKG